MAEIKKSYKLTQSPVVHFQFQFETADNLSLIFTVMIVGTWEVNSFLQNIILNTHIPAV